MVDLINQSEDTISLKIVTIDTSVILRPQPIHPSNVHNQSGSSAENYYYSSMMGARRNHSGVICKIIKKNIILFFIFKQFFIFTLLI